MSSVASIGGIFIQDGQAWITNQREDRISVEHILESLTIYEEDWIINNLLLSSGQIWEVLEYAATIVRINAEQRCPSPSQEPQQATQKCAAYIESTHQGESAPGPRKALCEDDSIGQRLERIEAILQRICDFSFNGPTYRDS